MASINCERCGKPFNYPYLLRRHLKRKTPCALVVAQHELSEIEKLKPFSCHLCNHRFTSQSGLCHHVKKACKFVGNVQKSYEQALLRKEVSEQNKRIEELTAQMQVLMRTSTPTPAAPVSVEQIGTVNNVGGDQNNNFTINIFGSEDVSYLGRPQIRAVLDQALSTSSDPWTAAKLALTQIGYHVYSNPEHPENMTCYLPNKKRDEALVRMGDSWMARPCTEITSVMHSKSMDIMFQQQPFEDATKYGDLMLEARDREKDPAFIKEVKQNYRVILVENKNKVPSGKSK